MGSATRRRRRWRWGTRAFHSAKAEGKSDEWIRCRSAGVHDDCPSNEQILEFCEALSYLFADGIARLAIGNRPAMPIRDQPGRDKLLSEVTKGCSVYWGPFDELDSIYKEWLLCNNSELLHSMAGDSMQLIAAECNTECLISVLTTRVRVYMANKRCWPIGSETTGCASAAMQFWSLKGANLGECIQRCLATIGQLIVFYHRRVDTDKSYLTITADFSSAFAQGG